MDYTPIHRIPLIQDDQLFKMNSDTTALMLGMKIKPHETVLDIGTNHGVLLLEASTYQPSWMVGIDINDLAIEVAHKNMSLNNITNVSLICADVTKHKFDQKFDVIISNPPFFSESTHTYSQTPAKQFAKFTSTLTIESLLHVIKKNLKPQGRAYIVFRSASLASFFIEANKLKLSITDIQGVNDNRIEHYKSCVLTIEHGTSKSLVLSKPLQL
jgi:tRNA1Val (adenine37-N6)-methyltransferase